MCRVWSAEPWDTFSDPGWGLLEGGNLLTQQPREGGVSIHTKGVWRDSKDSCHELSYPLCVYPAVLDPCASGPCLNGGTCSSTHDHVSYHCACSLAFTGKDCGTGERTSGTGTRLGLQLLSPARGGWSLPGGGDLPGCCGSTV